MQTCMYTSNPNPYTLNPWSLLARHLSAAVAAYGDWDAAAAAVVAAAAAMFAAASIPAMFAV